MKLPVLFTLSKSGKKQSWEIQVVDEGNQSRTIVKYGFIDGKTTINERITKVGKFIGNINETSHYQQAVNEARSKWNKKKDMLYKEEEFDLINTVQKNLQLPKSILPMLALDYEKRGKDIVFPCFVQPKIDGARAIYRDGNMYSRTGKVFPKVAHILDELKNTNLVIDGELYSYDMTFQEVIGAIKKNKLESKKLVYIVYDIIDLENDYHTRLEILGKAVEKFKNTLLINTEVCGKEKDILKFHDKYVKEGYEGLILRNFNGKYEMKHRSKNLQKFKKFMDEEFEIIGATEGSGKEEGLVIWIAKTKDGKTFTVRPKGSYNERKALFKNAKKHIGKMLTVKYFELTDEGIPRFPIGISIRDYE
jgi:DNA ligase-1